MLPSHNPGIIRLINTMAETVAHVIIDVTGIMGVTGVTVTDINSYMRVSHCGGEVRVSHCGGVRVSYCGW